MLHVAESGYFSTSKVGVRADLSSLEDILQRINRSDSWAYLRGIVPLYGPDGGQIPSTKTPPRPWEILPEAVIKDGKKAWATEDIDAWIDRMKMRASRARNAHSANVMPLKENNNG